MTGRQMSGRCDPDREAAEALANASAQVDRALRAFVDRQPLDDFYELVRYRLGWRGHGAFPAAEAEMHLPAALCGLICQACGGSLDTALPLAMAISLLDKFGLLEEDIEQRRPGRGGRPTVWSIWGVPQAMNAADGMHALAKMALLDARGRIAPSAILHLEEALDECRLRLCEMVHHELQPPETRETPEPGRLALLFGCAAYGGCCLARCDTAVAGELRRFGELLGSMLAALSADPEAAHAHHDRAVEVLSHCQLESSAMLVGTAQYLLEHR